MVGLGARSGVPEKELAHAVEQALAAAGISVGEVADLATVDRRAGEPAINVMTNRYGWGLVAFQAAELAVVPVPNPSGKAQVEAGTASVSEAAAILAAGPGGRLVAEKRVFPRVTVAIAKRVPAQPERA